MRSHEGPGQQEGAAGVWAEDGLTYGTLSKIRKEGWSASKPHRYHQGTYLWPGFLIAIVKALQT